MIKAITFLKQLIAKILTSRWFIGSSIVGVIAVIVLGFYGYKYIKPFHERAQEYDLSKIDEVEHASIIFDRKGREIGRMYVENRSVISIDQMPQLLIDCLISQEDQRFWEHKGVDWIGLLRMVYLNVKALEITQGASTVTMQLARNAFNLKSEALKRGEGGKERKIVEIFLAHRIGTKFSSESGKRYILENYLNRVPFGHGYYGVRSAALGYFGKEPADLTLSEAASMIACIKNPSAFSPLRFPNNNKSARNHVFKRLNADGIIERAEYKRLCKNPIVTNPKPLRRGTSHLYEKISKLAREIVGEEAMSAGGYRINTTIDLDMQKKAEKTLLRNLSKIEANPAYAHQKYENFDSNKGFPEYLQGCLLVNNPKTGEVIAHVGGRNYSHTQFDFIDLGKRPLGTATLPFLYALGIEEGLSPSSNLRDEAIDNRLVMVGGREGILGEWGAETLSPKYEGQISLRHALSQSKMAASVRLGKDLGVKKFAEFCKSLGLTFPYEKDLLTRDLLGWVPVSTFEIARAYSAIPNGGQIPDRLYYINRIESSEGLLVYLSEEQKTEKIKPAMSNSTAFQIDNILRGVTEGDGNLADQSESLIKSGFQGGAKTGTPYNFEDAWAFAYNEHLVCSSWVGFQKGNQGAILPNGFAKHIAWPVVSDYFSSIPEEKRGSLPKKPNGIVKKEICKVSGLLATRYCFEEVVGENENTYNSTACHEYYKDGDQPVEICFIHMGQDGSSNFVDHYAPTKGVTAAKPILTVDPVKPSSPVVVGTDPYGAVKNSSTKEEVTALKGAYASGLLILNDEVAGETEAQITLPRPKKLLLRVMSDDLNPQVTRAIVVK